MVKTPRTRHSGSSRAPVTIDLDADQVARAEDAALPKSKAVPPEKGQAQEVKAKTSPAPKTARIEEPGISKEPPPSPEPRPEPKPEPKPEPEPKPVSGPEPVSASVPAGRHGLGLLAAGVVGGIIALAGAAGLQYAGLVNTPQQDAPADHGDQIAQLQEQISELAAARSDDGAAQQIKNLDSQVSLLESDLADLKETVGTNAPAGDNGEMLAALSQKIEQVETRIAAFDDISSAPPVDLAPLNDRIAGLEQQLGTVDEAVKEQQSRIGALDQSLGVVVRKQEELADQPKIALAIAASALKSALERGAPFEAELETFVAIAPDSVSFDPSGLALLRGQAQQGVATRSQIEAQVEAAADAMVAADNPVDENAGFAQRLIASAQSLVKVRPIGAVEGAGAPETVARLEADVRENNYAAALGEYETLSDPVKAAGAEFAGLLKAHMEAQAAVDALISQTMSESEG
ncbi:phage tail protein [Aquamicrobium segne]|uniref:Phage tail protein n=1 Tax=Aquamicrobium segne TaxID=469547 RepID=A0ABW0GUL2_9HYPH